MKLLSLHAHNVFSIGSIDLDLEDRGLVLVTGWSEDDNNGNMAGKSSVANRAIVWGLYGRTVDGIRADAVINTSIPNAKHCGVTLTFEGIDGETYRIYRARKPTGLLLSQLTNAPEGIEWIDLSKRNEKDTQELIDKLLGRDHKTFIQSNFFGQGRETSFLALPGSEQKAVIEEILPLNSLDEWKDAAKEELDAANRKVNEAVTEQRVAMEKEGLARAHLDSIKTQSASWATNHAHELASNLSKLKEAKALSSGLEKDIKELRDLVAAGDIVTVIQDLVAQEKMFSSNVNSLGYRIDVLTSDIDKRKARPDVCQSCKQSLSEELIKINDEDIKADKLKRDELVRQRSEQQAFQYNTACNLAIAYELQGVEAKLATKNQVPALTEKVLLLTGVTNPFSNLVDHAVEALRTEQEAGRSIRLKMGKLIEDRDHYKFWADAYGTDLKTMVFNQVCPFLERKANEFLRALGNGQIKVKFRTVKELKSGDSKDAFCVTASSSTGSTVFELFSGAEKQLTSFAVGMALSELASLQVQGASSFMILDEPFLYQSPENCERIITFVTNYLVGNKSTILLISNEDNLVNLVPNRVHVVKKKGVTSIE